MTTFLRSDTRRHMRLGKNRRKLQKWRRPKGRHSKIRKKRIGYPKSPSIGYGRPSKVRGLVHNKHPLVVYNMKDLMGAEKHRIIVLSSKIGARKRIDLIKKANEKGLTLMPMRGVKK